MLNIPAHGKSDFSMVIMKDSKTPEIYDIPRRPRWT